MKWVVEIAIVAKGKLRFLCWELDRFIFENLLRFSTFVLRNPMRTKGQIHPLQIILLTLSPPLVPLKSYCIFVERTLR